MGDILQPWHVIVVAIIVALFLARKGVFSGRSGGQERFQNQHQRLHLHESTESTQLPELKYCSECGKQIKRRAELCPLCGCRQAVV